MSTTEVLKWLQKRMQEQTQFPGLEVKNFTSSLRDPRVFVALVWLLDPSRAEAIAAPGFDGDGFRSDHIRLNGLGPIDEPPPPRGLALPEYGIVQI